MDSTHHISFRADDRSYFSLIKKDIQKMAAAGGFGSAKLAKIDLIVSEITSNLSKHADGGELLVSLGRQSPGGVFLEIISLDDGPGISDISRVVADGYSSSSTLGHGLGSIKRLSDKFDMYSLKDWGTVLFTRVYREDLPFFQREWLEFSALNIAKPGEAVSGDGYYFEQTEGGCKILVADGLGHGANAHLAVEKACEAFVGCEEKTATGIIRFIHGEIRKTRGMVGVVFLYDAKVKKWSVTGVGNIAVKWMGRNNVRNHFSYNGIIGHNIPTTLNDQQILQEEFTQFIACSDGIRSRWDPGRFPQILKHHGMIVAAAIYKEFSRKTDDMSVIVCKSF